MGNERLQVDVGRASAPAVRKPSAAIEFQAIASLLRKSRTAFESSISGISMEPTIPHGARIRIRPAEDDNYQVGQIVACVIGDSLFAHRIVYCGHAGRGGSVVLTQGDGWILCDPPTRKSLILGVVVQFFDGDAWRAPAGRIGRGSWEEGVAGASYWLVRFSLLIHREFARRVAGTCLTLGSIFKRLRLRG